LNRNGKKVIAPSRNHVEKVLISRINGIHVKGRV
jgi:hypothetical protein